MDTDMDSSTPTSEASSPPEDSGANHQIIAAALRTAADGLEQAASEFEKPAPANSDTVLIEIRQLRNELGQLALQMRATYVEPWVIFIYIPVANNYVFSDANSTTRLHNNAVVRAADHGIHPLHSIHTSQPIARFPATLEELNHLGCMFSTGNISEMPILTTSSS
jgi:hypothetical protein